jgi:hypothetical protein
MPFFVSQQSSVAEHMVNNWKFCLVADGHKSYTKPVIVFVISVTKPDEGGP